MFALTYVIVPVTDIAPVDAIRASLARFRKGDRGEMPDAWFAFDDKMEALRRLHEAPLTCINHDDVLRIEAGTSQSSALNYQYLNKAALRDEMRRRGVREWYPRFADMMGLDAFIETFCPGMERNPETGAYGHWRTPLGKWDWWELGGRFDGVIIGKPNRRRGRLVAQVSSGNHAGRAMMSAVEEGFRIFLDRKPEPTIPIREERNIVPAATLLADMRARRRRLLPAALVLPPGSIDEHLRWIDTWPNFWLVQPLAWLGLPPDASAHDLLKAAYTRFEDHQVAAVACHY